MIHHPIVFFDGDCAFCNASVHFIIKHDPTIRFRFSSLQSLYGKSFLVKHPELSEIDSLILVEGNRHFTYSSAVLKITKHLHGFWKLFFIFVLIPKPFRDILYRIIAKYRRHLKKKNLKCTMPAPEELDRFLT